MKIIHKTDLPELNLIHRGKVRDIYDFNDKLLFIASDRISAFDVVFNDAIPNKGFVLTQLSLFWFNKLKQICSNHLITNNVDEYPEICKKYKDILDGRSTLVKKVKIFPFECIVRGYITGSAWNEYKHHKSICGIELREGLLESEKFDEPIFTPTTKEEVGKHDENISFDQFVNKIGKSTAEKLKEISINLYLEANRIANSKGVIIADTKFELGLDNDEIILADEVLTPDSSRFWLAKEYKVNTSQNSFDKQIVRDYLIKINFNKKPPPPPLPKVIIEKTAQRYLEIYKILTGD